MTTLDEARRRRNRGAVASGETAMTLAEKIAAVERAVFGWDGRDRDRDSFRAVLADLRMIERVGGSTFSDLLEELTRRLPADEALAEARRAGAEEMRERAAQYLDGFSQRPDIWEIAADIRALPV